MNRSTFALFVALLIHLFFMLLFWVLGTIMPEIKHPKIEEEKIKISLKELQTKPKKIIPKKKQDTHGKIDKIVPKREIAPPMPKGSQLKKIVKSAPIKYQEQKTPKVPKLNPKPKQVKKPSFIKKAPTQTESNVFIPMKKEKKKNIIIKEEKKQKTPMNWLYDNKAQFEEPTKKVEKLNRTSSGKNIKELYGSKFGELSQAQQEYILDNQEIMRRITQQILTRQASVSNLQGLNVNRTNIIEFYLHPNGDMSDFKFLEKSGYFILDDITRVTIEYAYSKYPRPKEKTLIRYNVFYNLKSY